MGNSKESNKSDDFHRILTEMKKDKSRRININPQKKYLLLMKDTLTDTKLPESLKKLILETLTQKVTQVELIETVTCINALRNNQIQSSFARSQITSRERPESKFVRVNFEENFFRKILRNFNFMQKDLQEQAAELSPSKIQKNHTKSSRNQTSFDQVENERKEKLKVIGQVMRKELNRIIHPFGKLNKAFAEYVEGNSQQFAPQNCKEDVYQRTVQRLINQWCGYLEVSCLAPYKKWIMSYTDIEEGYYAKWLRNLLLQQIWVVNNSYLFSMLATVIQRCKVLPAIDIKQLHDSAALLTPSLFSIDPKLQIQGHFFDSIYQMSQIVSRSKPQKILSQLQTVKKRVCTDIDNYHRLVELGEVYEIDSDNILGIVAYILCKIASKIDEIHTHLIFLRIVYGQRVYFSMGLGSYMLSTVFGALQFLQSQQFRELIKEKRDKQPLSKFQGQMGQGETKVGTSVPGEGSIPEVVSQADKGEMHTNSLLSHL